MVEKSASPLPHFGALRELVDFFESHDMGDYWDSMPETDPRPWQICTLAQARLARSSEPCWQGSQRRSWHVGPIGAWSR